MNAVPAAAGATAPLAQQLQRVGAAIAASRDVDDIMLNLSAELCALFNAERLSIYALEQDQDQDQSSLVSKVKTGLTSFKQLKLPVSADSIAGYAALSGKMLNLLDVYDDTELARHASTLRFQRGVDRRTGYRTREMLVAPIADGVGGGVLGVIQLINNRDGGAFPTMIEEGVRVLSRMLAAAFSANARAAPRARSRFAALLPESVLPRARLELAWQLASATQRDIEDVLIDDLALKTVLVGRALADFYAVPYFTFDSAHPPPLQLLAQFAAAEVLRQQWLPLKESGQGLFMLAVDVDLARADAGVALAFPGATPIWCVTTRREFDAMVAQLFGASSAPPTPAAVAAVAAPAPASATPAQVPADLAELVSNMALQAHRHGIRQLHIDTMPGEVAGEVRFQVSGIFTTGSAPDSEADH